MRTSTYGLDDELNDPVTLYRNLPWALLPPNRARPSIRLTPVRLAGGLGNDSPVMLGPSPLVRSASAPPDYVPSPPASRQHRTGRHGVWPIAEDDRRSFPVPPEVIETRRREKECSECCMRCIVVVTTLRWVLVAIALLGAACVVAGIVFGVMSSTLDRNTFFVLSFTFIGLGIVLVIVVCIGWRCAPAGHEPCHDLCRLGGTSHDMGFTAYDGAMPRAPQLMHRGRNQWYGGFLYPEYRYGTPPPSYATSMEQYRQRMQRRTDEAPAGSSIVGTSTITSLGNVSSLPGTPPPSYHSRAAPRTRPSISGLVELHPNRRGDPPPPYGDGSRRPSVVTVLDVVTEDTGGHSVVVDSSPISPTNAGESVVVILQEHRRQVEDSEAELMTEDYFTATETSVIIDRSSSHPPSDSLPETPPVRSVVLRENQSVRSMVRRFEDLGRLTDMKYSTTEAPEISGELRASQFSGSSNNLNASEVRISGNLRRDSPSHHETSAGLRVHRLERSTPGTVSGGGDGFTIDETTEVSRQDLDMNLVRSNVFSRTESDRDLDGSTICFVGDSSANETEKFCRDLSGGQSLEDPEIGESGI